MAIIFFFVSMKIHQKNIHNSDIYAIEKYTSTAHWQTTISLSDSIYETLNEWSKPICKLLKFELTRYLHPWKRMKILAIIRICGVPVQDGATVPGNFL